MTQRSSTQSCLQPQRVANVLPGSRPFLAADNSDDLEQGPAAQTAHDFGRIGLFAGEAPPAVAPIQRQAYKPPTDLAGFLSQKRGAADPGKQVARTPKKKACKPDKPEEKKDEEREAEANKAAFAELPFAEDETLGGLLPEKGSESASEQPERSGSKKSRRRKPKRRRRSRRKKAQRENPDLLRDLISERKPE